MIKCENDEVIASKIRGIYGNNHSESNEVNSTGCCRGSTISKMQRGISESGTGLFGDDPGIDGITAGFAVAICKSIK